ncbi:MAG: hypothetical protein ACTS5I_00245 [Rhodanobacter sp.]
MTAPVDVLAVMDAELSMLDGRGMTARFNEAREARAAVAELLEALSEDAAKPASVTLDYRNRTDGEPEGHHWWAFKRDELEADGYSGGFEYVDGTELFWRDGYSDRVTAALARCGK